MATFSNMLKGLLVHKPAAEPQWVPPAEDIYRLRPLPNEHIHIFYKNIDNSHVSREVDKRAQRLGWKSIGGGGLAAIIAIALLLPLSLTIQASYKLNELKTERLAYQHELAELELEQASMLSLDKLERLARLQKFIDPEPGKVIYLNPSGDAAYAMKRKQRENPE